ncbi:MAG: hypothetical protein D6704_12095 [Nitrospirae bacterium]|nr:MAG: hypothetical protein D6704_12095 [Nitrospirota bacterium]
MTDQQPGLWYLETTETFVRFYVFLAQYVDRCLHVSHRESLPEEEFHQHFAATTTQMLGQLAGNRVVKGKVEEEYNRVSALVKAWHDKPGDAHVRQDLEKERETLRIKMLALSDLLAVFRSV